MKTKQYDIYYYDAATLALLKIQLGEWGPEVNLEYPDLTSSSPFVLFKLVVNGNSLPPEFVPNNQGVLAGQTLKRDSLYADSTKLTERTITTNEKDSLNTKQIKLYPNPNSGDFTLELPTSFVLGTITVSDISGREVYAMKLEAKTCNLQLHLPKGMYYLHFMNETMVQTLQFVVQ